MSHASASDPEAPSHKKRSWCRRVDTHSLLYGQETCASLLKETRKVPDYDQFPHKNVTSDQVSLRAACLATQARKEALQFPSPAHSIHTYRDRVKRGRER